MAGLSQANIRKIVSLYFGWRLPFLIICLAIGLVLIAAGIVLLRHSNLGAENPDRSRLVPAASIDLESNSETSTKNPQLQTITYQVKSGDSLWRLAEQFYGDGQLYPLLALANNLPSQTKLEIGQKLILSNIKDAQLKTGLADTTSELSPQTYQVKLGDSLWQIAQMELQSGYDWMQIYQLNHELIGADPNLIFPEQVLKLPAPV